jgi:hypothetical protein
VISLAIPALVAVAVAVVAASAMRGAAPRLAVPLLAVLASLAGAGAVAALLGLAMGTGAVPGIAGVVRWCTPLEPSDGHVPWPVGVGAATVLVVGARRVHRLRTRTRSVRDAASAAPGPLVVLPVDRPEAYAVPLHDGGRIVVSTGMLRALDADERRVLLAHERAHLDHRHHRYLATGEIASAMVPPLAVLARRIRFATERWADETAAAEVGDRKLVARALARAALAADGEPTTGVLAFGRGDMPRRVEALLQDPPARRTLRAGLASFAGATGLVGAGAASSVQFHHLARLVEHVCRV